MTRSDPSARRRPFAIGQLHIDEAGLDHFAALSSRRFKIHYTQTHSSPRIPVPLDLAGRTRQERSQSEPTVEISPIQAPGDGARNDSTTRSQIFFSGRIRESGATPKRVSSEKGCTPFVERSPASASDTLPDAPLTASLSADQG